MKDLSQLLDDYKDDGQTESEGVFTINFAKAREKLAKYQLPDPHFLVLKFVQAANLAAEEIQFRTKERLEVKFLNCPEISLEQIASKLASANLQGDQQAETHIVTALSCLMKLCATPIVLTYDCAQTQTRRKLEVGDSLEQTVGSQEVRLSLLTLESEMPAELSASKLEELLINRCAIYSHPIYLDGHRVKGKRPQTSGSHRSQYFTTNQTLISLTWSPTPERLEAWLPATRKVKTQPAPHAAWLEITVDFDPKAQIWLSKNGVLMECRSPKVKYPGVSGVVCADHLSTDLTGLQFLKSEALDELDEWIRKKVPELRGRALDGLRSLRAQGQPANPNAHVKHGHSVIGAAVGALGFWVSSKFSTGEPVVFGLVNFIVWATVATLVMGLLMWLQGAALGPRSDEKAAQFIEDALK